MPPNVTTSFRFRGSRDLSRAFLSSFAVTDSATSLTGITVNSCIPAERDIDPLAINFPRAGLNVARISGQFRRRKVTDDYAGSELTGISGGGYIAFSLINRLRLIEIQ